MFKAYTRYFDFKGRSGRKEYWLFVLLTLLLAVAAMVIDSAVFGVELGEDGFQPAYTLVALANLIPSIAVGVRRLHDTGRTGWWLLIGLVPILGLLVLLFFMIKPGDPETNRFGAPDTGLPREAAATVS